MDRVTSLSHISIHVPREGDDGVPACEIQVGKISIHVPREGDDLPDRRTARVRRDFNPRPP